MKIYLDNIIYSKTKNGGVSNYWYELTKFLLEEKRDELTFFEDSNVASNFHRKLLQIDADSIISVDNSSILSRLLPVRHKSSEKFIYHSSYFRKLSGAKNQIEVTTIYDFIHNYYSSFLKKEIHNNLKFNAIRRSKGIICISKNTYNDLQKFCPIKSHQKAEVIYVGVSDDYFPINNFSDKDNLFLQKHNLENDFILYIGGRTNYKNFDFCASILNENKKLKLVIVGGGVLTEEEIKLFHKESLERVVFIPSAQNSELNILFNNARALLYPSSYEGFGIPVVEAMRAGCPVIGLNNATIREVAEDSALLLDNLTVAEFENNIQKLNNLEFRKQIIAKGLEGSKKYSWDKSSRETREFYESLY